MNKSDYWDGEIFVCGGQRFGLNAALRTVLINAPDGKATSQDNSQPIEKPVSDSLDTPLSESVTKENRCIVCGKLLTGCRSHKKTCSTKCRKVASRGKQLVFAGVNNG